MSHVSIFRMPRIVTFLALPSNAALDCGFPAVACSLLSCPRRAGLRRRETKMRETKSQQEKKKGKLGFITMCVMLENRMFAQCGDMPFVKSVAKVAIHRAAEYYPYRCPKGSHPGC